MNNKIAQLNVILSIEDILKNRYKELDKKDKNEKYEICYNIHKLNQSAVVKIIKKKSKLAVACDNSFPSDNLKNNEDMLNMTRSLWKRYNGIVQSMVGKDIDKENNKIITSLCNNMERLVNAIYHIKRFNGSEHIVEGSDESRAVVK